MATPISSSSSGKINWNEVVINPSNLKCSSLPLFSLRNQYSINFHLAWIGFFVAFLSWFAFSPLIPDAIKKDLKLTSAQVGNSNIVSICGTFLVRIVSGPLVDRYGPRRVMAGLLVLGAIPSALAGTAHSAIALYFIRFFISILGATFVTCQAWTTVFFDTNVVGTANALAAGWGNAGGGVTFLVMIALYDGLLSSGLPSRIAWRASFAIIPAPLLLLVAVAVLIFGTDHPAGKWSERHKAITRPQGSEEIPDDTQTKASPDKNKEEPEENRISHFTSSHPSLFDAPVVVVSALDYAVNKPLTLKLALSLLCTPLTWLPALGYFTTLGYELAMDANLASILFLLYESKTFGQTKAGYIASVFGFLNVFFRPLGGFLGDSVYRRWGVPGKKYLMVSLGITQGLFSLGLGIYVTNHQHPSLGVIIGMIIVLAVSSEAASGVNFSLVPHCNPCSNGFMSGFVGSMGNLGGVIYMLVFRFQPIPIGQGFWITGIIAIGLNVLMSVIPVPQI